MESCCDQASNASFKDIFFLDTVVLAHVTNRKELLYDYIAAPPETFAKIRHTRLQVLGTGTLKFRLPDGSILLFNKVKHVPSSRNLISIARATANGAAFRILRDEFYDENLGLEFGVRTSPDKGALYKLLFPCLPADSTCACVKATLSVPKALGVSRSCVKAPLELVHSTISGPIFPSLNKNLYYVVFVDEYTHYMTAYPIKKKSDVYECTKSYFLQSEKFFQNRGGYKPIAFRTDNSDEYMSSKLQRFLKAQGIAHQHSTESIYPNAVSKRAIRTIKEKSLSIMREASLPMCFWAEAVVCSTYLINRSPSTAIDNQLPYERWYQSLPELDNLRPFGCLAHVYAPEQLKSSAWSLGTIRGIMVGYTNHKYRIFDLDSGDVVISKDVTFNEKFFPYKNRIAY